MGKLDGKIALITRGSDGIGLSTAQHFIVEGAEHVFISGRRQEALDAAVKQPGGKKVTAIQADSSKLYSVIQKEKGRLDIVFANAGIGPTALLGSITEKHFDDLINVNVNGVLFTVQKALPLLVDGASIILNASVSFVKAAPAMSVNTISPEPVETSVLRGFAKNEEENKELIEFFKSVSLMDRIATTDEIAKAVVFLASTDSSYITGIELFVDGGVAQYEGEGEESSYHDPDFVHAKGLFKWHMKFKWLPFKWSVDEKFEKSVDLLNGQ